MIEDDGGYVATLQDLLDREAIRDCMYRYCHGIDRLDAETLRNCYWPDAHDDHTVFTGNAYEFIDFIVPALSGLLASTHTVANILIRVHGDRAHVETYFHVFQREHDAAASEDYDYETGGRYIDIFEKRSGEWRVSKRQLVRDWYQVTYGTGDWRRYIRPAEGPHGSVKETDPVRAIFGPLRGPRITTG